MVVVVSGLVSGEVVERRFWEIDDVERKKEVEEWWESRRYVLLMFR